MPRIPFILINSAFILIFTLTGKSYCQTKLTIKNNLYTSGQIDTIFVLKPRTYVCFKHNEQDYFELPEFNEPVRDTIKKSLKTYFSSAYTSGDIQGLSQKPKTKTKKVVEFLTIEPTGLLQDSVFHLFYELHNEMFKDVRVPSNIFDMMEAENADHMMLVFQYGYIKDDKIVKKEEIISFVVGVLTGTFPPTSSFHNELTCCILDQKTRSIAYYGYIKMGANPLTRKTYQMELSYLFDAYLTKKKLIGNR